MEPNEVSEFLTATCTEVLTVLAEQHKAEKFFLRIDLEHMGTNPVYALFDGSTFLSRCTLKDIIRAGGGMAMYMLISMEVVKIVKQIFNETMRRMEFDDTKRMCVRLFMSETNVPTISIFKDGQHLDSVAIAEAIGNS